MISAEIHQRFYRSCTFPTFLLFTKDDLRFYCQMCGGEWSRSGGDIPYCIFLHAWRKHISLSLCYINFSESFQFLQKEDKKEQKSNSILHLLPPILLRLMAFF